MKSLPPVRPDFFSRIGKALFFDRAGINGRLVHDNVTALDDISNRIGGRKDRTEIRPAGAVDRSRHRYDIKIGVGQTRRLVLEPQCRLFEIGRRDFKRTVVSGTQLLDAVRINIKADDRHPGSRKCDGNRQSDIAEADNSEFPAVAQNCGPSNCAVWLWDRTSIRMGKLSRKTRLMEIGSSKVSK